MREGQPGQVARLLIEKDADVDEPDDVGNAPLYYACRANHIDVVRLLLSNLAKVDHTNRDNHSALYAACEKCYPDIARVLLENGADGTLT